MLSKYKKLVIVFVGLLAMSGVALAELGPPEGVGEKGQEQGDNDRGRTGECKDLLGVSLEGTQDRNRDGGCGGEPGPNQNPDPGHGKGK
jgi:hypothetical protein